MHKRLAENGLRYIRGKVIGSVEEAIEFYDAESLGEVEDIMGMEGYLAEMSKNF